MKANELRQKTVKELEQVQANLFVESFKLRMQKATGQLVRHDQLRKVKRNIARIYTVLTEKGKLK